MKHIIPITTAAIFCLLGSSMSMAANVTQINRYATVDNKPSIAQVNPLLAVQQVRFPLNVVTVSDAVTYWMRYSGFTLEAESRRSRALQEALLLPLPQVVRNLGPLTVEEGLLVLIGKGVFTLSKDLLHRKVNFSLKPSYQPSRGQTV